MNEVDETTRLLDAMQAEIQSWPPGSSPGQRMKELGLDVERIVHFMQQMARRTSAYYRETYPGDTVLQNTMMTAMQLWLLGLRTGKALGFADAMKERKR